MLALLNFLSLVITVVLVPLFFLPFVSNLFDFPKSAALFLFSLISLILFFLGAWRKKEGVIIRTPADIPLIVIFLISAFSTLFSFDRLESALAIKGGISLFSVFALALFYFLFIQTVRSFKKIQIILGSFLISSILVNLVATLNIFQSLLPKYFIKVASLIIRNSSFNFIGSPSQLSIFVSISAVLSIGFLLLSRAKLLVAISLINTISAVPLLYMFNLKIGYLTLGIGVAILLALLFSKFNEMHLRKHLLILPFIILAFSVVFYTGIMPSVYKTNLPNEVFLNKSTSFSIAKDTILGSPLRFILGSGPSTFVYDFSRFRPEDINQSAFSQIRFQQASNFYSEILATFGVFGIVAFSVFIFLILGIGFYTFLKEKAAAGVQEGLALKEREGLSLIFLALTASLIIIAWFANPNFSVLFLFFLFLSLFFSSAVLNYKEEFKVTRLKFSMPEKYAPLFYFGFSLTALIVFLVSASIVRATYAEYYNFLSQKVSLNKSEALEKARNFTQKAIKLNPFYAPYYLNDSQLAIAIISQEVGDKDKTGQLNQDKIAKLLADAINQSKKAADLSSRNVAIFEARAQIFKNASLFAKDALKWVELSYARAAELEPTNSNHFNELGKAQQVLALNDKGKVTDPQKFQAAIENFKKAIELQPNYVDGRVNLANLYERSEDINAAIQILKEGLEHTNIQSEVYFYELGRYLYNRSMIKGNKRAEADFQEAVNYFKESEKINPAYANALYSLSIAYERAGDKKQAIVYLERVAKLNPTNKDIQKKLKQLR